MTQNLAFATPYVPGAIDKERAAMAAVSTGDRAEAHAASRRRAGLTRETVWLQETPDGHVAITYLEADDLDRAMETLMTSDDPHDVWFRELLEEVHGIDMSEPMQPPELLIDLSF